jgi:hypothetical protein
MTKFQMQEWQRISVEQALESMYGELLAANSEIVYVPKVN